MNSRRRAELQRKLSMGAVPRPPADLLERLKSDIPKHLEPQPEQEVPLRSMALTMRVAASLILLFTTGLVTWRVMESRPDSVALVRDERMFPAVQRTARGKAASAVAENTQTGDAIEAVRLEPAPALDIPEASPVVSTFATSASADSAVSSEEAVEGTASSANEVRGRETDLAAAMPREQTFEYAPEVAPQATSRQAGGASAVPPAAPQPQAVAPPPPPRVALESASRKDEESITVTADAPAVGAVSGSAARITSAAETSRQERKSVEPSLTAKARVLGISVDPNAFATVREAVERGDITPRDGIDVSAIVNYFAGKAAKAPSDGLRLEVELSALPSQTPRDRVLLRFSVDTPKRGARAAETVAHNVSVSIDFNEQVVSASRRIGGESSIPMEAELRPNVAVTALYELDLKSPAASSQRVATLRLRWQEEAGGPFESFERTVLVRDLTAQWANATRRHRLASLSALWSEGLAARKNVPELAKKAEELATQAPQDRRARELANATNATAGKF
jgi:hypothetical protein